MNALTLAVTQAKLAQIAGLSLELEQLDEFIAETSTSPGAADHRELAIVIAEVQRVAHRQLSSGDARAA